RVAAEGRSLREGVRREEQRESEQDEQHLSGEIDERDYEGEAEDAAVAKQAEGGDARDHGAAEDDVPGLPDRPEHRRGRVVRNVKGRERDHDQVREEEPPTGDEAPEVGEGNPTQG